MSRKTILVFGIIMNHIIKPLNVVSVTVEIYRLDVASLAHPMLNGSSTLYAGFIASTRQTANLDGCYPS